ncbi:MAG: DUF309 domain-containing protein [Phycisphaerae bacterium]|nr:DUF309 domain-containing protein [Phycisphaerae bacterium]NUQ47695.1 DUF309 domain-containing protein [Phycisphaerae bacterium]
MPRLSEPLPPDPCFRRYGTRPFPPYRYVPTLNPHPCADPAGHSYEPPGTPPRRPRLPPPDRWEESEEYLFGADLYNHAYWWEAHETWESIWQSSDKSGPQGRFLQALIQVSAAHLQRHVGSVEGATRLLERSRTHFDFVQGRVPETYMGLNLPDFRERVDRYFSSETGAGFPFLLLTVRTRPAR